MSIYPIVCAPLYFEKVWGGRRLERLGKTLPAGKPIGESWELADLPTTSASGAGGAAARTSIVNGPLAGRTIHDALMAWGPDLLGAAAPTEGGEFPLLVKFLDARENLSVQVHPSPAYAAANRGANLKTESWYVLDAEPGSVIYKGVRPGVTPEAFKAHLDEGSVVDDLVAVPAVVGECHNLPSGTLHALGAGVLVAEVQTPSDTTFRVFDWGRAGRALHVREAMECIDFVPAPAATRFDDAAAALNHGFCRLVTTEYFSIDEARLPAGGRRPVSPMGMCAVLVVLEGTCILRSGGYGAEAVPLHAGQTAVVPAAVAGRTILECQSPCRVLRASLT